MRSILTALLLLPVLAGAEDGARRQVPAVRAEAPPTLDGVLDDPCWSGASTFTEFTLKDTQKPLPYATTAYLCYDDECLYAALRADDPEPERLVAQETKRNGRIWNDDVLEVAVDPKHQFQDYFWFAVNPIGTQYEEIPGGSSSNITWRGDWKGAAKRTPTGWAAEFAIPWKMLQPPRGTKAMGVFFARKVARINDWALSPNLGTQWDARTMAEWTGLQIPDIRRRPVFLFYEQAALKEGSERKGVQAYDIGLDAKHMTSSGHHWLATLNPDFENIEGAVEGADFSYTERWLPDRRPFFTDGQGYFPGDRLLYTPRIQDVAAAAKAYSPSLGRVQYATLATVGSHGHHNTVGRVSYRLRDKPHRGFAVTSVYHREPGLTNHAFDVGGDMEFIGKGGRANFGTSFAATNTSGADGDGTSFQIGANYNANPGGVSYGARFEQMGRFFNPALGYVPDRDYRRGNVWMNFFRKVGHGLIEEHGIWASAGRSDRLNRDRFTDGRNIGTFMDLRPSTWVYFGVNEGYRRPYHDNSVSASFGWGRKTLHRGGDVSFGFGHTNGGVHRSYSLGNSFRPWKDFGFRVSVEQSRIDYPASRGGPDYERSQLVVSLNYDISPERGLAGRLVAVAPGIGRLFGKGSRHNPYFTYRQALRRGVDAYVIVGDPNAEEWTPRFACKLLTPF